MRLPALFLVLFALLLTAPVFALEDMPGPLPPQPACPEPATIPVIIECEDGEISQVGRIVEATGRILFLAGNRRITASDVSYDLDTEQGVMHNVVFTTCDETPPHYRVEAEEVTVLPNNKLHARRVSLFIGKIRVLVVPSMKLRMGGNASSQRVFPTPGYDRRDGFTLSQILRLTDTERWRTELDLTITTNHGMQGDLGSAYGVDGELDRFPGRFLSYDSMRAKVFSLPQEPAGGPCDPQLLRPVGAARLRAFGRLTLRQRTFDIRNPGVVVSRQPELGATYVGRQLSLTRQQLDPRIELYPELVATWGRYEEQPGPSGFISRRLVSAVGGLNVLPLGPNTTVQPVFSYRYSSYSNGDEYRLSAFGLDASHLFQNGSFASGRYIKRHASGQTPFEFDDLDIAEEVEAAFQARLKRHTLALIVSYDLAIGGVYEWEGMYAYRTDCTSTWVRWNNRLKRFSYEVTLINL